MAGGSRSAKTDWAPETSPSIDSRVAALENVPLAGLATVVHAPPTTFVSQLMFDDTGSTGGLYAWVGTSAGAYVKVGLATT